MTKSIYRAYAFFMFTHLSQLLKKGIGINVDIHPCEDDKNTVIIITFNSDGKYNTNIHEEKSMAESLVVAGVEHFVSHLDGIRIEGTKTVAFADRIVYIKENDVDLFSEDAVRSNVMTLAKHRIGRA